MKKGFTLVEILVAISLMAMMVGGVLVNYSNSNKKQKVVQAVTKLKQTLETAKSNAMNGKKDAAVCGTGSTATPLDGWAVGMPILDKKYYLQGKCGGNYFPVLPEIITLPSDLSLYRNPLLLNEVLFKPINQGAKISFFSAIFDTATLRITGNSYEGSVTVNSAGEITVSNVGPMACNPFLSICNAPYPCCGACIVIWCI